MGEGGGRSFGTTRELQRLKQQAMEYYRENDVPRRLEELLNSTFYLQPADVYGHLANCFSKLAKPPTICRVVGKSVLDGLGLPTLQVEIFCTIQNFPKSICSVVISTHFEVLENVLPELADTEQEARSEAVRIAVQWVNETITEELQGLTPSDQAEVDQVLRTFFGNKAQEDKERRELEKSLEDTRVSIPSPAPPPPPPPPPAKKRGQKQGRNDTFTEKPIVPPEPVEPVLNGSMAIGAVSLAVAKTRAILDNNPLYLNIALLKQSGQEQPTKLTLPLPMVSLVSCGKSSPGKLNLMKEVMCIPHPGVTAKQGVEMLLEIQKHINKTIEMPPPPKTETKKGHNGSKRSQSRGKYEVMLGTYKNAAEMVDLYVDLINRCYILAGAASKSISKLLEGGDISTPKSSGLIIRHTNQTTISDLVEITSLLDSKQRVAVFGSAEGESSDDSLVDLAIGLGVRFIKLGGLSRGERITKYNRLFTIEEELLQSGTLGFNEEHIFFPLNDDTEKGTEAPEAVATVAGEPAELPEPIFPTEVMEASAKA
ncbi:enolase 4 isoform X4 [Mustela putorius furo]|uniref:Enolase 4 n=1 Tax=Mustela putorius furo TaxID=9669 RepID=A0A8U0RH62_MUSPF|nr:enolase 4 isoform X4 [Mustela putorius furo]